MSDRAGQRWVAATLVLLAAAAVGTDVARLQAPQGERYVNYMDVWPSDFRAGLEATRSLLAGNDPYRVALPTAKASDKFVVDGVTYRYNYPPSHLLLYVPIALVTRDDEKAGRIWFHLLLLMLLALSVLVWRLADSVVETPAIAIAALLPLLTIQPGALLALERAQSDIVLSLLAWSAITAASRGRWGWAGFFSVAAALMKPYAAVLAIGIVSVGVDWRQLRASAIGAIAALALLFVPVARFAGGASARSAARSDVLGQLAKLGAAQRRLCHIPSVRRAGSRSVLHAVRARQSAFVVVRAARAARGNAAGATLSLVMFAVCALEAMIGWSQTTYSYAMLYLLPGLLVIALTQPAIAARLELTRREQLLLAPLLVASLVAFWMFRPWWSTTNKPVAGFAVIAIVWLMLTLAATTLLRPARRLISPDPAP